MWRKGKSQLYLDSPCEIIFIFKNKNWHKSAISQGKKKRPGRESAQSAYRNRGNVGFTLAVALANGRGKRQALCFGAEITGFGAMCRCRFIRDSSSAKAGESTQSGEAAQRVETRRGHDFGRIDLQLRRRMAKAFAARQKKRSPGRNLSTLTPRRHVA